MTAKRYLLVMVGCLECGGSTWAKGSYETEEAARAAIPDGYAERDIYGPFPLGVMDNREWRSSQGAAVIFDLERP